MVATTDPWTVKLLAAGKPAHELAGRSLHEIRARAEELEATAPLDVSGLEPGAVVGFDTETWRILPGRLAPPIVCFSFAWHSDNRIDSYLCNRADGVATIRALLRGTDATLVAHNAAFDWAAILAADPRLWSDVWTAHDDGRIRCTKIRELLFSVASGAANRQTPRASLAACVERYFSEHIEGKAGPDVWRVRYHELDGVPINEWPEDAASYATLDAVYCLRVFDVQQLRSIDFGGPFNGEALPDELWQTRAAFALHLLSCWGIRADPHSVAALRTELEQRIGIADEILRSVGFVRSNGSKDTKAIQSAVRTKFEAAGLEFPTTPKGQISCAGDVLRTVACSSGECTPEAPCAEPLHILSRRNEDAGELSKYVEHLEAAATHPINPRVSPIKATGRCSVSKPPYQQFPRRPGVRECIVPRRGYLLIGADYSAAELVTLAQILIWLVGESTLADALNAGIDPHLRTGAAILGIDYAEAIRRKAAKDKEVKDARQLAKALNFGLPGGLGPRTFVAYAWGSWGVRVTEHRARELKALWLDLYPEVRVYFEIVGRRCEDGGGVFDLVQPGSGRFRGSVGYCDGCNSPFQGLAADACKRALYHIQKACWSSQASPLFGTRPILVLHDEIIAEAPENKAATAAEELAQLMIKDLSALCPDLEAACNAEPWISRYWTKAAETVRDEVGRLMIWEPEQ